MSPTLQNDPTIIRLTNTLDILTGKIDEWRKQDEELRVFLLGRVGEDGYVDRNNKNVQAIADQVWRIEQERMLEKKAAAQKLADDNARWSEKYRGAIQIVIALLALVSPIVTAIVTYKLVIAVPTP